MTKVENIIIRKYQNKDIKEHTMLISIHFFLKKC